MSQEVKTLTVSLVCGCGEARIPAVEGKHSFKCGKCRTKTVVIIETNYKNEVRKVTVR